MTSTDIVTTKAQPPLVVLRERLEARKKELGFALVDVKPDQFIRAVITSATINPEILACNWSSLWTACMRACRDDLLPDGVEGAIVPFRDKAQWIPMYQGLLRRFRRSGQFRSLTANVVREGEEWSRWVDENGEHLRHVPGDDIAAPVVKAYALATTKDGGFFLAVMPIGEIEKVEKMSRATRDDAPWKLWREEMMKKTVLRRLCKYLPSGQDALNEEDDEPAPIEPMAMMPPGAKPPAHHPSRSGAAAYDQFAGAPATVQIRRTSEEPAETQEPGPADTARIGTDTGQALSADDAGPAPGEITPNEQSRLDLAWARGRTDRAQGMKRSAVPPELRAQDRAAEALAWAKGWVGEPLGG